MRRSMAALTLLVLCTVTRGAAAADVSTPDLLRKRVRLTLEGDRRARGRLMAMDADTVTLFPDGKTAAVRIERARVRRLEVSRGHTRYTLVGLAIGLGVGLVVAGRQEDKCAPDKWCFPEVNRAISVGGGLIGGAVLGSAVTTERWQDVGEPRLQLGLAVPPRGAGVGASLRVSF
jgi:hypothetical protein